MGKLDKKRMGTILAYILFGLVIAVTVVPIIIGAGYTYPCEDDWSFEMGGRVMSADNGNILGAIKGAYGYYRS